MNKWALFCDESKDYRIPAEPEAGEKVTLWFRTGKKEAEGVQLVILEEGEEKREVKLIYKGSDLYFDYYSYTFVVGENSLHYYFKAVAGNQEIFYHRRGTDSNLNEYDRDSFFAICPGMHIPDWAKGAVFYQIFVDRFCNGDKTNDVLEKEYSYVQGFPTHRVENWDEDIANLDVGHFYGGDLQGVINKLDYLKSLGVDVIYLNPIFVSPSNHKYDTQDYDYVDPHYGVIVEDEGELIQNGASDNRKATRYISRVTRKANLEASNQLFIHLVKEAHDRGMKVVLDGVFNHCGSFNKWLDRERIYEGQNGYAKGAYVSADSPYRDFFNFTKEDWPYNEHYSGWWNHSTLPKLNYEGSAQLCDYIMEIGKKWVSPPFNVDGWRLDVAADLGQSEEFNHKFWKRFRKEVKTANPEAIILAEHYGDVKPWLKGDEWDTVMNYDAFMEPVSWFLTGMEKHSDEYIGQLKNDGARFFQVMNMNMSRFHHSSLLTAMNELSNHDHSRFMTRTNSRAGRLDRCGKEEASIAINKGIFREGVVIQMTWPGAPTIYYGDEAGVCGWTDPDNRRTYPWGKEDFELIEFHRYISKIHRQNEALKTGSLKQLGYGQGMIAYGRFNQNEAIVIALNNLEHKVTVTLPVWEIGMKDDDEAVRIMATNEDNYNIGKVTKKVENGNLTIDIDAFGSVIYRKK